MIVTCAFDSAMINLGLYKRCKSRGERAITMERKRTAYLNEIMSSEAREDVKVGLRNLWTRIEKAEVERKNADRTEKAWLQKLQTGRGDDISDAKERDSKVYQPDFRKKRRCIGEY